MLWAGALAEETLGKGSEAEKNLRDLDNAGSLLNRNGLPLYCLPSIGPFHSGVQPAEAGSSNGG